MRAGVRLGSKRSQGRDREESGNIPGNRARSKVASKQRQTSGGEECHTHSKCFGNQTQVKARSYRKQRHSFLRRLRSKERKEKERWLNFGNSFSLGLFANVVGLVVTLRVTIICYCPSSVQLRVMKTTLSFWKCCFICFQVGLNGGSAPRSSSFRYLLVRPRGMSLTG